MNLFNFLFNNNKKKKHSKLPEEKIGLYYDKMAGAAGHINCTECSFIVLIDVWAHDYKKWAIKTSYQCLSCGEFKNPSLFKDDTVAACSCGGTLSNKHKLFCPKCKSDKLQCLLFY